MHERQRQRMVIIHHRIFSAVKKRAYYLFLFKFVIILRNAEEKTLILLS